MPTYFIYSRKSSEAEDRQILSIDSQVSELKRFASPKGFKVLEVLTEAKSAKAPGRPIFNSMMQRLYRGEADGILCWKLDRLARNPVDGGTIIWAMKEHGVKIITPFQTYGQFEDNVVMMYFEFGMAQKYVDDLAKNVKRGLRAKAESGWFPSCTPPGYINQVNDEGRNVIARDPKRFGLVRKCWDLMLTGNHTPAEIREIANTAWGFRTKRGNPLGRSTIYSIFGNPFYHGVYEYPKGSDVWQTGRHTPMVTEEEFDAVQHLLARSKRMPHNRKVFAFTGLMRCGGCDSAVTAEEKHQIICSQCHYKFAHRRRESCPSCKLPIAEMKNPLKLHYVYYHCTRSQNPRCAQRGIERKELEKQVIQSLGTIRLPLLHDLWLDRSLARSCGSREELKTLAVIRELFATATPDVQRQVAMAVFTGMTLTNQKVTFSLKSPFLFRELQLPSSPEQNPFAEQAVQKDMARA
jgi:site-specific DNA recombinase